VIFIPENIPGFGFSKKDYPDLSEVEDRQVGGSVPFGGKMEIH